MQQTDDKENFLPEPFVHNELKSNAVSDIDRKRLKLLARLEKRNSTTRSAKDVQQPKEQKLQEDAEILQVKALTEWINSMLTPQVDAEIENPNEIESLLQQSKDANRRLQDMLTTSLATFNTVKLSQRKNSNSDELNVMNYFLKRNSKKLLNKRAKEFYLKSSTPAKIEKLVASGKITVRQEVKVASNIGIQVILCSALLSFQPIWLRLALETIFDTEIDFSQCDETKFKYLRIMSSFILHKVLANFELVENNKKCVIGKQKRLLTPAGVNIIHKNFLTKFLTIIYLIECFILENYMPSNPCMFWSTSKYKSISDIYAMLSRTVLSGTSSIKSLQQIGFFTVYRQNFFEEYNYVVHNFQTDLCDGVIFAKLVEILILKKGNKFVNLVALLRNPSGDRLRKLFNMRTVLQVCSECFSDQIKEDEFSPDDIVSGKYEKLIELVWKLIGIFVGDEIVELRREFMANYAKPVESLNDKLFYTIEMKRLNRAASTIQRWWRRSIITYRKKLLLVKSLQPLSPLNFLDVSATYKKPSSSFNISTSNEKSPASSGFLSSKVESSTTTVILNSLVEHSTSNEEFLTSPDISSFIVEGLVCLNNSSSNEECPAFSTILGSNEKSPATTAFLNSDVKNSTFPNISSLNEKSPTTTALSSLNEKSPTTTALLSLNEKSPAFPAIINSNEKLPATTAFSNSNEESPDFPAVLSSNEESPAFTAFSKSDVDHSVCLNISSSNEESPVITAVSTSNEEFLTSPDISSFIVEGLVCLNNSSLNEECPAFSIILGFNEKLPATTAFSNSDVKNSVCLNISSSNEESRASPAVSTSNKESPAFTAPSNSDVDHSVCLNIYGSNEESRASPAILSSIKESTAITAVSSSNKESPDFLAVLSSNEESPAITAILNSVVDHSVCSNISEIGDVSVKKSTQNLDEINYIKNLRLISATTRIQKWWRNCINARCNFDLSENILQQTDLEKLSAIRQRALNVEANTARFRHLISNVMAFETKTSNRQVQDSIDATDNAEDLPNLTAAKVEPNCVNPVFLLDFEEPLNVRIDRHLAALHDESLGRRVDAAVALEKLSKGNRTNAEYILNHGIVGSIIDSTERSNRSVPHLVMLCAFSKLFLTILETATEAARVFVGEFLHDLIFNLVKQMYNNYKEANLVSYNAKILTLVKSYNFVTFKENLLQIRYSWYLKQLEKHFNHLPANDIRLVALRNNLKKLLA